MADQDELEGFRPTHYFSRAWALLTMERGWIKPVLVMTVALFVPIVGWLGVVGYVVEWSRLVAWGTNAAPRRHGVRVGSCIASGWRAFVVALVWGICSGVIGAVLTSVPLLGGLLGLAWTVFSLFLLMVVMVAILRATIYQRIRAGLRVKTIWQMATHDAAGLMRILGMLAVGALIVWAICLAALLVSFASLLPTMLYWASYFGEYGAIMSGQMRSILAFRMLMELLGSLGPGIVVVVVVTWFFGSVMALLGFAALGLWIRQFDVASWGREDEPVPGLDTPPVASADPYAPPRDPAGPTASETAAAAAAASWSEPAPAPAHAEPAAAPEPDDEVVEVTPLAVAPSVVVEPEAEKDAPAPADDGPVTPGDAPDDDAEAGPFSD